MNQQRLFKLGQGMLATLLVTFTGAGQADIAKGKHLYDDNCVACHIDLMGGDGSVMHTRPNRRVNDLPGLTRQVNFCKDSLDLQWFDDQVDNVVDYLNTQYYRFK